jgi:hypothetical protein
VDGRRVLLLCLLKERWGLLASTEFSGIDITALDQEILLFSASIITQVVDTNGEFLRDVLVTIERDTR